MTTNTERADWALKALTTFSDDCGPPLDDAATAIADLISDLGHEADRRGLDFRSIVEHGVGMWSAERRAPLIEGLGNEPGANDIATIDIEEKYKTSADEKAMADGWYEYESEWRRNHQDDGGYDYAASADLALAGSYSTERLPGRVFAMIEDLSREALIALLGDRPYPGDNAELREIARVEYESGALSAEEITAAWNDDTWNGKS